MPGTSLRMCPWGSDPLRLRTFSLAALRIRLTHAHLLDDLVRFLTRMGFTVREFSHDTIEVEIAERHDTAAIAAQLQLYVQVWTATRQGVSAAFEPADQGETQQA